MKITTQEFGKIIKTIEAAYPNKFKLNNEQMEVWYAMLGGYNAREMYFATKSYILSHSFPPSISDLIESGQPYFGAEAIAND